MVVVTLDRAPLAAPLFVKHDFDGTRVHPDANSGDDGDMSTRQTLAAAARVPAVVLPAVHAPNGWVSDPQVKSDTFMVVNPTFRPPAATDGDEGGCECGTVVEWTRHGSDMVVSGQLCSFRRSRVSVKVRSTSVNAGQTRAEPVSSRF